MCVNPDTGAVWWRECSKEAYADGIAGAVDGYWNWQSSRAGTREGKRMGFPRFKKKGRDADRVSFTTGAMRVEPDRRHLTLPMIGTVRTHENTRRLQRLIAKDRARMLAISRAPQRHPARRQRPGPRAATAATAGGATPIHGSVSTSVCGASPPSPMRTAPFSNKCPIPARWRRHSKSYGMPAAPARAVRKAHGAIVRRSIEISRLHRRVNDIRTHHLHSPHNTVGQNSRPHSC